MAAARGNVEKARLLIDAGADVNRQCEIDAGEAPLMEAALQGRAGTVRLLLACGADPAMRDLFHERTALESAQYAMKGPDPDVLERLQDPDQRRILADLQSQIFDHMFENSKLSPEMIEWLRPRLGKTDAAEQYRQSAEKTAREGNFEEVIRLLSMHT